MNSTEYKLYHESQMKNNNGSNAVHTFFCIFFTVQCTLLCAIQEKKQLPLQYLYEYIVIVLPLILAHTLLAEYIYHLNIIIMIVLLYNVVNLNIPKMLEIFNDSNRISRKRLHTITSLRGLTYLITAVAILAVDFKHFPRYLAKTEMYGYSLMDTGVGLFVLMSGLVHRDFQNDNLLKIGKSNFKVISILLILGIGRFVSIKQMNYHEHVTEYGVHWNFFFTLAFCKLISTMFLLASNKPLLLSIITIFIHEILLYNSLEEWVFNSSLRLTLIDANREGISSNLGYVCLYLFAVHIKKLLLKENKSPLKKLVSYAIASVFLAYFVNLFRPTSRTLANAGYILFLISVLLVILSLLLFFEICLENKKVFQSPLIVSAINDNGLIYFLICNISTGLVNLMFQTLLLSAGNTFVILNIYMVSTIFVTVLLNKLDIQI
ncbi:phosphatidylinositol-glycan biosynthesis class W protein-like [Pieris napi]|uniref:phosphatidylinositol-glycan biosynthesis class W protein-like n=1 Tax=Pieris napi TaxID=78633 RepID=UPI001FBA3DD0|nr:phosphatidylinositol-glycan biosynthesis class W protein-like [Pieris napi]